MREKRSKSPAFQLYAADFLTDTQSMTAQELGVYFRLMCSQWINKGVPVEHPKLSRLAGVSVKVFKKVWPEIEHKFVKKEVNGAIVLVNERLEESRADKESYIESQSLKGKLSAAKKKAEKDKLNSTGVENRLEPKSNSSSSPSSSTSLKEKTNEKETSENQIVETNEMVETESKIPSDSEKEFESMWRYFFEEYKKEGKPLGSKTEANKNFIKNLKTYKVEEIKQSFYNHFQDCVLKGYGFKHLASFLNPSKKYVDEWKNGSENHQALLELKRKPTSTKNNGQRFESKQERIERDIKEYGDNVSSVLNDLFKDVDFEGESEPKLLQ